MNPIHSFSLPPSSYHVSIDLSDLGALKVSTQGQLFKVSTTLKSTDQLKKQLPEIQAFFDKLFYNKIHLSEGKVKDLKIRVENKKILVQFSQKLGNSSLYEEKVVSFKNRSIREIFQESTSTNSLTPIMEISNITPVPVINPLVKAFKRFANFLLGRSKLTTRLTKEFKFIVSKLPEVIQEQILDRFHKISEEEHQLARYLKDKLDLSSSGMDEHQLLSEIFRGGYVMIDDGGKTYEELCKNLKNKHARLSSHESNGVTQYAIRGPIVKECLFSTKEIIQPDGSTKKVSWFQLERYPAKLIYHIPHLYTWALYKLTGQNQGPYGESSHREGSNPIVLKLRS